MRSSRRSRVKASPQQVWDVISSVDALPKWYHGVDSARHTGGPEEGVGRRQTIKRNLYGRDVDLEQDVVGWDPPGYLRLAHVRETIDGREVTGVRDFHTTIYLEANDDMTQATIEYSWSSGFGLAWLQGLLFGGRVMGRELKEMLRNIEALAAGETEASEDEPGEAEAGPEGGDS